MKDLTEMMLLELKRFVMLWPDISGTGIRGARACSMPADEVIDNRSVSKEDYCPPEE